MNKNHTLTVRLNDIEFDGVSEVAEKLRISKSEVVRRLFWTVRVLFSDKLTLKEVLLNIDDVDGDKPLSATLRNIPELLDNMIEKNSD
ncbi:MAG: hypothetical protein KAS66_03600 [Candidatus Omnitrophica bacterium]|nr:hypothetical protein [Candidatus Omnitrophota bacterium]